MKKIILLAFTVLMMVGCEKSSNKTQQEKVDEKYAKRTFIVDSCEYISFWKSSTHKGNCRFCEERDSIKWEKRKKELEELVIKLKEK
jgi:4-hydroxy-3-methylbut-2-enyl diphosphate reductase IspH